MHELEFKHIEFIATSEEDEGRIVARGYANDGLMMVGDNHIEFSRNDLMWDISCSVQMCNRLRQLDENLINSISLLFGHTSKKLYSISVDMKRLVLVDDYESNDGG